MAGRNIQDSTLTRRPEPRVNSFAIDPLHSAAYLRNLITYLNGSRQRRSGGNNRPSASPDRENAFLYCYRIPDTSTRNTSNPVLIGSPTIYTTSDAFISSRPNADCSEIVFATGYPSREWLAALLDHLGVDYRFLHSHLNFLQSAQRDWFVSPSVPSRRQHQIGLVIPSIIFLGTETRRIPAQDLHEARNSCAKQLQQQAKLFSGASSIRHGRSIIRHINIHSGDMMVLEQAVTITVTKNDRNVKVVVWSDAGDDRDLLPFPDTPRFSRVFQTMEFCPVFFERSLKLNEGPRENYTNEGIFPHTTQPLAALPCRYGETLDWCKIGSDPLLILQEIFHFQSSAASQYLNMLRQLTTETISRIPPTGEELPSMADLLHFDYTKTVLSQWCAHFKVLIGCLDDDILKGAGASGQQDEREKVQSTLRQDLKYLNDEGEALIALCESGKATIMSSFSVYESTRAAAESRLVTQLTKATNRITFIFLPISLVTSVFGMNFKQFGQGDLDITLWLAVTLPILAVCILINESGGWIVRSCSAVYTSCTGGR